MLAISSFTYRSGIGIKFSSRSLAPILLIQLVTIKSPAALGQPFSLSRTFNDPTPTTADFFGASVALDGNHVLIGARLDDTNGTNVGQVHLFDANTGDLLQVYNDPTPTGFDAFGVAVALDGAYTVVGASGGNINGLQAGQVHVYDTLSGALLHTLNEPTPAHADLFGRAVAISNGLILVGAPFDDTGKAEAGQAYLFDAATGVLLKTFSDPAPVNGGNFGNSVAIDGVNVLVGAESGASGTLSIGEAHLFDATSGALLRTISDPTLSRFGRFGSSVAINGNKALIGMPSGGVNDDPKGQAYLFDISTGQILQTFDDPTPTIRDLFGSTVALEGNLALVGALFDSTQGIFVGQAHLYDVSTGSLIQTFDDPTPTSSDQFGTAIALDAGRVLVGEIGDDINGKNIGHAHLFIPAPASFYLVLLGHMMILKRPKAGIVMIRAAK